MDFWANWIYILKYLRSTTTFIGLQRYGEYKIREHLQTFPFWLFAQKTFPHTMLSDTKLFLQPSVSCCKMFSATLQNVSCYKTFSDTKRFLPQNVSCSKRLLTKGIQTINARKRFFKETLCKDTFCGRKSLFRKRFVKKGNI